MKHKNLNLKIQNCLYAYQSYQLLLNTIKDAMKSGSFDRTHLLKTMNNLDNYVCDNSLVVDKYLEMHSKYFYVNENHQMEPNC